MRIQDVAPGWGREPGRILMHRGRVLQELLVVPSPGPARASRSPPTTSRATSTPSTGVELARAGEAQAVLVASHGRFLRPPGPALTARQQAALGLLAQGLTVRAIGTRLGISQSTVDKHVRDLYRRLGTQDCASTSRAAQVRGLLDGLTGEHWQDLLIVRDR